MLSTQLGGLLLVRHACLYAMMNQSLDHWLESVVCCHRAYCMNQLLVLNEVYSVQSRHNRTTNNT